jgi:hypothetical protein
MKPDLPQSVRRSGVFRNRVCRQRELSAAEALSPDGQRNIAAGAILLAHGCAIIVAISLRHAVAAGSKL